MIVILATLVGLVMLGLSALLYGLLCLATGSLEVGGECSLRRHRGSARVRSLRSRWRRRLYPNRTHVDDVRDGETDRVHRCIHPRVVLGVVVGIGSTVLVVRSG